MSLKLEVAETESRTVGSLDSNLIRLGKLCSREIEGKGKFTIKIYTYNRSHHHHIQNHFPNSRETNECSISFQIEIYSKDNGSRKVFHSFPNSWFSICIYRMLMVRGRSER